MGVDSMPANATELKNAVPSIVPTDLADVPEGERGEMELLAKLLEEAHQRPNLRRIASTDSPLSVGAVTAPFSRAILVAIRL